MRPPIGHGVKRSDLGPGGAVFVDVSGEVAFHAYAAIANYIRDAPGIGLLVPPGLAQLGEAMSRTAFNRPEPTRLEQLRAGQQAEHVNPKLLTTRQAAHVLQCSPRTVERRIADGALPVVYVGRSVRLRVEDVQAYIAPTPTQRNE